MVVSGSVDIADLVGHSVTPHPLRGGKLAIGVTAPAQGIEYEREPRLNVLWIITLQLAKRRLGLVLGEENQRVIIVNRSRSWVELDQSFVGCGCLVELSQPIGSPSDLPIR
jgi:hypothetical protein